MGTYINRGNDAFQMSRNSEYVDKSGLIAIMNSIINTRQRFCCVSRSRRFGKSMAAEMLAAYYDQSCDSRGLFADLSIAGDPSFEKHLNKYPVIYVDMTGFVTRFKDSSIVDGIKEELLDDIREAYPDLKPGEKDDFMKYLERISVARTKNSSSSSTSGMPCCASSTMLQPRKLSSTCCVACSRVPLAMFLQQSI